MLFASTPLAARIERAACRLMTESTRAAARRRPRAGVVVLPIAGGVATLADGGSPLNKVSGLGFEGAPDEARLEEVERTFRERGVPVQVELSCLADPAFGALLTRRGYVLQGFENVLALRLPFAGPGPPDTEIEIAASNAEGLDSWLDVVVTGFASPDVQGVPSHESFPREALERVIGDMAHAEGFVRYVALREGRPAGGASMMLGDGVAQLCGAATLPEHRRKGVQSALLGARLVEAGRAGCDVAVVTTQPGSKSQENVQRHGFELLYARAVLVREA